MPIPKKLLNEILADPYYKVCARKDETCEGRITFEHSYIYKNQIQEKWSIIPLCWHHHLGKGLNKEINHYIALQRADITDLQIRMPKKNWKQELLYLTNKYGTKGK